MLKGGAKHELSGMENEGHVIPRLDHLSEIGHILPYVYKRPARIAEHQNLRPKMNVHARGLDTALSQWIDHNAPLVDLFPYRSVAQYHSCNSCPLSVCG